MRILKRFFWLCFVFSLIIFSLAEDKAQQPKKMVITGARLIDGIGALPQENMIIVITGDKFSEIGSKKKIVIPEGAEVIDVKGKTVIPGLIDAHIHFTYPPKEEEFFLINEAISAFRAAHLLHELLMVGVTTVRDLSSYENVGVVAKRAFREGLFIGSRPLVVGQGISCTGGHGTEGERVGIVMEVNGSVGFRQAVREQLKRGADLIKILPPYSREEIKAAIEETHAWERFITVHSGVFKKQYDFVHWAVEAGADCIEHAYAIPDDVIQMMAERGVYCVPTLSILIKLGNQYKEKHPEWDWKIKKYFESIEIFRKMKRAGVKMGIGTDAVGENMAEYPWFYFEEVERFVEYGYTPMEAILAATKINAEICDAPERLGTIEKGKLADLLVIEDDPLKDIRNLRKVQLIIQGGKIIKR